MTILFVGSSPDDLGGATLPNTTANARDANFTPVGSLVVGDFDESGGGFTISHDRSLSTVTWYHFLFNTNQGTSYSGFADGYWFRIFSGNTEIGRLDVQDSNWTLQGGGISSTFITPFSANTDITYDVKVITDGTNVTLELYQNSVFVVSVSYASAVTAPNAIVLEHFDLVWSSTPRSYYYSEFIVTDNESTLNWRLATLEPGADGTHTAWLGGYADMVTSGDGLGISSDTAAEKESWTLTAYAGPPTSSAVRAVVNKFYGAPGMTGPTQITSFIRHAATDVDGATFPLTGGKPVVEILDNNPQTAAPWDTAQFATLEIGVKSVA